MLARDMEPGRSYRIKSGEIVVFSRIGGTGLMIVHPPGEPDMQSSFALAPTEYVEDVGRLKPSDVYGDDDDRYEAHKAREAIAKERDEAVELLKLCKDVIDDDLENRPARHSLGNLSARIQHFLSD